MRLEIWIIGVMIFLVAGVLGLIAASPDNVSVPKSTHEIEVSKSISIKEPTTMPIPVPEKEKVDEKFEVELNENISVEEVREKSIPAETSKEKMMPKIVEVDVTEGSGVPGCDETNECYVPYKVAIAVGGEVIWNNTDSAAHTVTSGNPTDGPDGEFDSSLFMSGTTFSVTFDDAGTYDYFCMVHPWMKGTVQVS